MVGAEGEPANALPQGSDVEVDEESEAVASESQVRQDLGDVKGLQVFHCLQLDDDLIRDKDVDAVSAIDNRVAISDSDLDLASERDSAELELAAKTVLVGGFQQAWSQRPMNVDAGADALLCK